MTQNFNDFDLAAPLKNSILRMNFSKPTPIQAETLPLTLAGQSLIGCAQTGSGKTIAYCLPMLQRLMAHPEEMALILVPTRELVKQVGDVLRSLLQGIENLSWVELIGGQAIQYQMQMLKRKPYPRIIVATPGRLIDLLDRNAVYLRSISFLVLDEADRMLDMGFAPQLKKIDAKLPSKHKRQTLMFSATLPPTVNKLVGHFLYNEARVTLGSPAGQTQHIQQSVISVEKDHKKDRLLDELRNRTSSVIVFVSSQHRTDRIANFLVKYGHSVSLIHGGRSQGQRNRAIKDFRSGETKVLVATDIAARGLDVPQVGTVINFDLPKAAEDYTHRIGRSGRAGNSGESLTFVSREDQQLWSRITKACRLNLGLQTLDLSLPVAEKKQKPQVQMQKSKREKRTDWNKKAIPEESFRKNKRNKKKKSNSETRFGKETWAAKRKTDAPASVENKREFRHKFRVKRKKRPSHQEHRNHFKWGVVAPRAKTHSA